MQSKTFGLGKQPWRTSFFNFSSLTGTTDFPVFTNPISSQLPVFSHLELVTFLTPSRSSGHSGALRSLDSHGTSLHSLHPSVSCNLTCLVWDLFLPEQHTFLYSSNPSSSNFPFSHLELVTFLSPWRDGGHGGAPLSWDSKGCGPLKPFLLCPF